MGESHREGRGYDNGLPYLKAEVRSMLDAFLEVMECYKKIRGEASWIICLLLLGKIESEGLRGESLG